MDSKSRWLTQSTQQLCWLMVTVEL